MTTKFLTEKQQEIEHLWDGMALKDVLITVLKEYRGQFQFIQQTMVRLRISEPTLRTWCSDLDININDYKNLVAEDVDPT